MLYILLIIIILIEAFSPKHIDTQYETLSYVSTSFSLSFRPFTYILVSFGVSAYCTEVNFISHFILLTTGGGEGSVVVACFDVDALEAAIAIVEVGLFRPYCLDLSLALGFYSGRLASSSQNL